MKAWQRIIDEFQDRLEEWGARDSLKVDWPTWTRGSRLITSRNMLVLQGAKDILLYVKVRSVAPWFWGITKNRLRLLRESPCAWFVVLLAGSPEAGYLVPASEVDSCVESGQWRLASDGDFKIHPATLPEESYFGSVREFGSKLVGYSGP